MNPQKNKETDEKKIKYDENIEELNNYYNKVSNEIKELFELFEIKVKKKDEERTFIDPSKETTISPIEKIKKIFQISNKLKKNRTLLLKLRSKLHSINTKKYNYRPGENKEETIANTTAHIYKVERIIKSLEEELSQL